MRIFAHDADGWTQVCQVELPETEPNVVKWCEVDGSEHLLAVGADDGHVRVFCVSTPK